MTRSGSILGRVIGGLEVHGVAMRWEGVHCECADAECGCVGACTALACYCWGGVAEGNWQYLCHRCGLRLVERGTAEAGKPVEEEEEDNANRP